MGRRCRLCPSHTLILDNGREFCGRPESHRYELLRGLEGIEHRPTRGHTPRTNGFVARMNRTLLDECFRVAGRMTWYLEPAEIQRDLDVFLEYYNLPTQPPGLSPRRPHAGAGAARGARDRRALAVTHRRLIVAEGEEEQGPLAA
jgi:hypothetical protein